LPVILALALLKRTRPRYPLLVLELPPSNPKRPRDVKGARRSGGASCRIAIIAHSRPQHAGKLVESQPLFLVRSKLSALPRPLHGTRLVTTDIDSPTHSAQPQRATFWRSFSARWMSRCASRFASVSRLSYCFLPLPTPISSFANPFFR